jgi:hypothetical protein
MAIAEPVLEAMQAAQANVPAVLKTFMSAEGMNQTSLGAIVGLDQRQVSYRMLHPESITVSELAGWAAHFGVAVSTFYKPKREALRDLYGGNSPTVGSRKRPAQAA